MKTFRTLDLAVEYYGIVEAIQLPHHLKEQLLRAASSISLNLSEGNAKRSYADKKRIYQIALGSFRESQTILRLAKYKNLELEKLADNLGACLYKLTVFKTPKRAEEERM
jgi:four helix bundle protein